MLFIRQGATHKVVIGPAVAVGDGFTPVTNLAVSSADEAEVILHDNGTVVDISGYTFAAITTADGYYHLTLQSGISNTVGHMTVVINDDSLILPIRQDFTVLEEAAYDAMFASSADPKADINVGSIDANAITATSIASDAITAAKIADGAIDAATFAAGAITATVIATGAIDADAIADGAIDAGAFAADAITAAKIAADVTTELQSGLATSAALATVDTVVDAIKVQTDKLTFTVANQLDANVQSINDAALGGDGSSGDPWGPAA